MDLETFFRDNEDWRPFADLVAYPPLPEELMSEFSDVSSEVLARCMEYVTECGGYVTRGAIYCRVRREKDEPRATSDRWATMLSLNAVPAIKTSDTFWAGRKTWVEVFGEDYANKIKKGLAKKGVNILPGYEYMPELVRQDMGFGPHNPDPEAVVPFNGARSYIKNLCEKRGYSCDGAVTVQGRAPERDELADENCIPLGEDIIRRKACDMVKKDPSLRFKTKAELRQKVLEKHGPSRK